MYLASRKTLFPLTALALLGLSSLAQAQDYNASSYFNGKNPNGPYSFGYESKLGNQFTLYTTYTQAYHPTGSTGTLQEWSTIMGSLPAIFHNASSSDFVQPAGNSVVTIAPDQLALHPGAAGEYSVLRFTAQTTGLYSVSALFNAADTTPTTTDVHVLINNQDAFSNNIQTVGGTADYLNTVTLTAGSTVDFAVGYGNNHTYASDTTGLFANVAAVPELSTLLGFGSFVTIGGLAAFRQRKSARKKTV